MENVLLICTVLAGLFVFTVLWHGIIGTFKRSWALALVGFLFLFPIYIFWVLYEAPIQIKQIWQKETEKQELAAMKKAAEKSEKK